MKNEKLSNTIKSIKEWNKDRKFENKNSKIYSVSKIEKVNDGLRIYISDPCCSATYNGEKQHEYSFQFLNKLNKLLSCNGYKLLNENDEMFIPMTPVEGKLRKINCKDRNGRIYKTTEVPSMYYVECVLI